MKLTLTFEIEISDIPEKDRLEMLNDAGMEDEDMPRISAMSEPQVRAEVTDAFYAMFDGSSYEDQSDMWAGSNFYGYITSIIAAPSPQSDAVAHDVLDSPARVGGVVFKAGVSHGTVIRAAQRHYAHRSDAMRSPAEREGLMKRLDGVIDQSVALFLADQSPDMLRRYREALDVLDDVSDPSPAPNLQGLAKSPQTEASSAACQTTTTWSQCHETSSDLSSTKPTTTTAPLKVNSQSVSMSGQNIAPEPIASTSCADTQDFPSNNQQVPVYPIEDEDLRYWRVWWHGSGPQRGDHIMLASRFDLGYERDIAYLGDQHHEAVSALVYLHNTAVDKLRAAVEAPSPQPREGGK